jgi:hypothetical protein
MAEAEAVLAGTGLAREACQDVSLPIFNQQRKIVTYRRISP